MSPRLGQEKRVAEAVIDIRVKSNSKQSQGVAKNTELSAIAQCKFLRSLGCDTRNDA